MGHNDAGRVRVDPDVYCKYAMGRVFSSAGTRCFGESRSSESTSMTDGTGYRAAA